MAPKLILSGNRRIKVNIHVVKLEWSSQLFVIKMNPKIEKKS